MPKLTINQVLQQGIDAHKAGKVKEAHRLYAAIIKAQPKHPDANHNTGLLTVGFGKIEQALPFFKTALEANPSNPQFWYSHIIALIKLERFIDAKVLLGQAKSKGIKGADFDQLEQRLNQANKALFIKPNNADGFYNMGIALQKQSKLEEAIEAYNKALSLKPEYAEAYYNMGIALQKQSKLEEAIEAYNKALSLKPNYVGAYNNMGNSLQGQGKLDEAIASYNQALSLKPDYAEAYNNMGLTLKKKGKLEEAIKTYNKALAIKPDYADVFNNLGATLKDQGKLKEAVEAYNKALAIDPDYEKAYYNMGLTLREQGKLEEAIKAYTNALTINPTYVKAICKMGDILKEQGKHEAAIDAYNKALAIKPDYAEAQHMVSSLTGQTTTSAPKKYIENLFDGYSKKFEQSLVENLEYKIPQLLTDIILKEHGIGTLGSVLDLGCGTGLSGLEIKNFCSNLEGIDLSKKMLELANTKNVYDKLVHTDILSFLANAELCFDYFIATDVFIYVGDLSELFWLIKSRNKRKGRLAFSTEATRKEGFHLETSGRYSHSKSYIESLCKKFDISISYYSEVDLRKENGAFLTGGLYLLSFN